MASPQQIGTVAGRLARRWMPKLEQTAHSASAQKLGRAAGQMAGRLAPSSKQTADLARNSGLFVKHVLPAAVKPMHSLWHQILAFLFFFFAVSGAFWMWRHRATPDPLEFGFVLFIVVIAAGYGMSSFRKSRRISRL